MIRAARGGFAEQAAFIKAIIDIISPGNKDSIDSVRNYVSRVVSEIKQGVHVLVVDPFPPGKHDPAGIHQAIWDEFEKADFELPKGKD